MAKSYLPSGWAEPTIIGVYLQWIEEKGRSAQTYRIYRTILRNVAYWLETKRSVGLLEATHVDLRSWRTNLNLADSSITLYVTVVRGFYEWAHRSRVIDVDPAWNIPAPPLRPGYPRPMAERSLELAIRCAPRVIRAILVLAAYAGLRAGEIAGLRREHIRDDLPRSVLQFRGKGGKERVVALSPYVWSVLLDLGLPHRGPIIPRADGQPGPNRPNRISSLANGYLRDLGFDDRLHGLRHRFGTASAHATNGNLLLVGKAMGHASTNTTKRYTAASEPDMHAMVAAIQPRLTLQTPDGQPVQASRAGEHHGVEERSRGHDLHDSPDHAPLV